MDILFHMFKETLSDDQKIMLLSDVCSHSYYEQEKYSWSLMLIKNIDRRLLIDKTYEFLISHLAHTFKKVILVLNLPKIKTRKGKIKWSNKIYNQNIYIIFKDQFKIKYSSFYSYVIDLIQGVNHDLNCEWSSQLQQKCIDICINWFYDFEDGFPLYLCDNNEITLKYTLNEINEMLEFDGCTIEDLDCDDLKCPYMYLNYKIKTQEEIDSVIIPNFRIYKIPYEFNITIDLKYELNVTTIFPIECILLYPKVKNAIKKIKYLYKEQIIYDETDHFYINIMQLTLFNKIIDDNLYILPFNDNIFKKSIESNIDTSINNVKLILKSSVETDVTVCYIQIVNFNFKNNVCNIIEIKT